MNHIPTRTSRYAVASLGVLIAAAAAAQPQERPASVQVSRAQVRQLAPSVHATGLVQSRAAADLAAGGRRPAAVGRGARNVGFSR